jgi:hypothetical protein
MKRMYSRSGPFCLLFSRPEGEAVTSARSRRLSPLRGLTLNTR